MHHTNIYHILYQDTQLLGISSPMSSHRLSSSFRSYPSHLFSINHIIIILLYILCIKQRYIISYIRTHSCSASPLRCHRTGSPPPPDHPTASPSPDSFQHCWWCWFFRWIINITFFYIRTRSCLSGSHTGSPPPPDHPSASPSQRAAFLLSGRLAPKPARPRRPAHVRYLGFGIVGGDLGGGGSGVGGSGGEGRLLWGPRWSTWTSRSLLAVSIW